MTIGISGTDRSPKIPRRQWGSDFHTGKSSYSEMNADDAEVAFLIDQFETVAGAIFALCVRHAAKNTDGCW